MGPILKNSTAMNKKMALIFSLPEVSGSQWTFAGRQKKKVKSDQDLSNFRLFLPLHIKSDRVFGIVLYNVTTKW